MVKGIFRCTECGFHTDNPYLIRNHVVCIHGVEL
jgi:hypothetical protein